MNLFLSETFSVTVAMDTTKMFSILLATSFAVSQYPGSMNTNCTFCRLNHVGVLFDPYKSISEIITDTPSRIRNRLYFVSKVSTEFKHLVIDLLEGLSQNKVLLLAAIALWNKQMFESNSSALLEVSIFIFYSPGVDGLFALQKVVNETNLIYSHTITALHFYHDLENFNTTSFRVEFLTARRLFPRPKYKLGLYAGAAKIERHIRTRQEAFVKEIRHSFYLIDFLMLDILSAFKNHISPSVSSIVKTNTELVNVSMEFLNWYLDQQILFGATVLWPDTFQGGTIDFQRFIQFWHEMAAWGSSKNVLVILGDAFDNLSRFTPWRRTCGWWRIIENSSYTNTSQCTFQDKPTSQKIEEVKSKADIASKFKQPINFDKKLIAVKFDPFESLYYIYHVQQVNTKILHLLINNVAMKFSKLFFDISTRIENTTPMTYSAKQMITAEMANYNADHSLNPVQVILSVNVNDTNVLQIVRNAIFAKTVTMILLPTTDHRKINKFYDDMNTSISQPSVPMGLYFPIKNCGNQSDLEYLLPRLRGRVNYIYFRYLIGDPDEYGYWTGIDRVLDLVFARMENCKQIIATISTTTSVGFEVGYSDSKGVITDDYESLVLFWTEVESWARKTNTQIIFDGAYDTPHRGLGTFKGLAHMGWWKVLRTQSDKTKVAFLEKREVALQKLKEAESFMKSTEYSQNLNIALIIVLAGVLAVASLLIICFINHKFNIRIQSRNLVMDNPSVQVLDKTVFLKESSTLIGSGNFGEVYKCRMAQFLEEVAVKVSVENSDTGAESILAEAKVMSYVGNHCNIVQLLGICQLESLFIVMEYCCYGSLLSYLHKMANGKIKKGPSRYQLLQYCLQIAKGLQFLEMKKVIHGDLSARNVLLNEHQVCKISDFGLSRKLENYEIYMRKCSEPLPWRWMAYESLTKLEFSTKSDIWSLGVTFWEVFTLGQVPYPNMTWNETFCCKLADGLRLTQPNWSNLAMYDLMLLCWDIRSQERPKIDEVISKVFNLLGTEYVEVL